MTAGAAGRIGIRADHLFDGYRFHEDPVLVVVEDGRIGAVDFSRAVPPQDMTLVDLGESTLLPGLVDAHAHLCWDPDGNSEDLARDPYRVLVDRARRHAEAALSSGITTIRDLGDRDFATLALREEYRQGTTVGPELVVSGPPLTRSGGHCWFLGGEADSAEALVEAVQERAARGVDWIKVMATGGFTTAGTDPGRPQIGGGPKAPRHDYTSPDPAMSPPRASRPLQSGRPLGGRTRCGRPPRRCGRARNWRSGGQSRRRSDNVPAGR